MINLTIIYIFRRLKYGNRWGGLKCSSEKYFLTSFFKTAPNKKMKMSYQPFLNSYTHLPALRRSPVPERYHEFQENTAPTSRIVINV